MKTAGRRGWVLLQVLLGAAVCGFIGALILRLVTQSGVYGANLSDTVVKNKQAEAAINRVQTAWNSAGATCASSASAGVNCSGSSCACTCTVAGMPSVQSAAGTGGSCDLTVVVP